MDLHDLAPGVDAPRRLNAIVEIPRGGQAKYEYDPAMGLFRLDRVLFSAVHYPGHYGFVPGTRAGDGDPVDVLVQGAFESFTGALIEVRPVGMLRMRDEKGDDEKVLCVPVADPRYREVTEVAHVAPHFLREVEHFFRIYKDLEGLAVTTLGWEPRGIAEQYVLDSILPRADEADGAGA
ncbi:MAG: inorganic diphosphatase [Dehalococcoidia bacterium]